MAVTQQRSEAESPQRRGWAPEDKIVLLEKMRILHFEGILWPPDKTDSARVAGRYFAPVNEVRAKPSFPLFI